MEDSVSNEERVRNLVFDALDEVNATQPPERRVEKRGDAPLFGPEGVLNSLGLITLVVAVEQRIEAALGAAGMLLDTEAPPRDDNPFATVSAFVAYVMETLRTHGHG